VNNNGYIHSDLFKEILNDVNKSLNEELDMEHHFYLLGKSFLELNKNNNSTLDFIKNKFGDNWESVRFNNIVRIGADIENTGLASIPRATLVGALLYQKEKLRLKHKNN
jgi:hypothetical protein